MVRIYHVRPSLQIRRRLVTRRIAWLLVATVAVPVTAVPGLADVKMVRDGDDTTGRLDIEFATHSHNAPDRRPRRFRHTVSTHRKWRNCLFSVRGCGAQSGRRAYLELLLNTDSDHKPDWNAWIERDSGRWHGTVCAIVAEGDPVCHVVRVSRPNDRSVTLAFARRAVLDAKADHYGWRVKTQLFFARGCPSNPERDYCLDFAPGRHRYVRHDL